jgi:hypothetical protein
MTKQERVWWRHSIDGYLPEPILEFCESQIQLQARESLKQIVTTAEKRGLIGVPLTLGKMADLGSEFTTWLCRPDSQSVERMLSIVLGEYEMVDASRSDILEGYLLETQSINDELHVTFSPLNPVSPEATV